MTRPTVPRPSMDKINAAIQQLLDFWHHRYWPALHGLLDAYRFGSLSAPNGSIVELVRFNLESFELDDQGVTALFGLELTWLVVDTSYLELAAKHRDVESTTKGQNIDSNLEQNVSA